jgi:mono/diheme cytochrome c family protein
MYVTVDWPGPSNPDYTTDWTDMQFAFSTAGISAGGIFNSSDYIAFECDIKVDVTNSYTALDGTYGAIELMINNPWEYVVEGAPLAATNGWQHFTGYFSTIPGGTYEEAVIGLLSQGTGTLTNTVSYWIDNIVFTESSTVTTNPPASTNQLTSVLTYHNDNARTGQNTNEVLLTTSNVNVTSFGLLFNYAVDGYVFAQPLLLTNVAIPGMGTHNVVYVATEHDSIYAFDADSNAGSNAAPLWQVHLINPLLGVSNVSAAAYNPSYILGPEVGITATPVIDPANGTLYVVAYTTEVSQGVTNYVHRLHALDVATGNEQAGSPVEVICTNYPGTGAPGQNDSDGHGHVSWSGVRLFDRPALLLNNGVVYVGMGSHYDAQPCHGWVLAYDAQSLAQIGVFNTTPNGVAGGLWMGGGGVAADAEGNLYFTTANGNFSTNYPTPTSYNLGDSFVKLSATNGLSLADYFTPSNQAALSANDIDLGSGGVMLLPDSAGSAAHPHLMLGGGKEGILFLVDRDNLGHFNSTNQVVQQWVVNTLNETGDSGPGGSLLTPSFFNNYVYYHGRQDLLRAYAVTNGSISTSPASISSFEVAVAGGGMAVSAMGTNNAIVWLADTDNYWTSGSTVLYAFDAYNLNHVFYNSTQAGSRDAAGAAIRFTSPIIANGKVYFGCQYALDVYGNGVFLTPPTIRPNGGTFTNSVMVTMTDTATNVSLYYTLNGTVPTTNSLLYNGPIELTNSAAVSVIAAKPGAVNSAVTSASFVNGSSAGSGTGLTGAYYSDVPSNEVFDYALTPALTRIDPTVDFTWYSGTPEPTFADTNFAVRWTGMIQPQYSEDYTLYLRTPGNVRLWLNGDLLINTGVLDIQPVSTTWNASVALTAQQFYNVEVDFYYYTSGEPTAPGVQFFWSSPSTPQAILPETQLYPATNPPPAVVLTTPTNGTSLTASASTTVSAIAEDQYNSIASVSFYANGGFLGAVTNVPYTLTASGLMAGSYALTAVASDTTGITSTSAPVAITVTAGSGLPYGLTTNGTLAPFLNQNMPGAFNGSFPGSIPLLLSETGAYANTPARTPAAGLIPYAPNTILWSDGATKSRYLALPNNTAPITPSEQIGFAPTGQWTFPSGTIFVKNFDLVVNATNPAVPLRRLETRLLVRDTNGAAYGVTYKWRADDSEADLLTNSLTEAILVTNDTGVFTQNWYYPSPMDCLTCHTAVAGYVLGVNTRQLNGTNTYPATGVTDNQLRTLNRLGVLNPAFDETAIATYEYLSSITNPTASLVQRARSYLDANCAQCHQPGGTGPTFDARYDTPLASQNIIGVAAVKGNLGYDNVDIVTPDDIWRSAMYARIDTTNAAIKMPPLARNLIDTNAVAVFAAWINSLPGTPAEAPPTISPAGGTFTGGITVTILPPDTDAKVYYTLDGSLPTTNSLQYTGPFNLTNTATVSANAFETGFINSVAPSYSFTILPGVSFTAPGFLTNGMFEMEISGLPGQSYVIQTSTDLVNWIPVMTNVPDTSPFYLAVPGATNGGNSFYRAIQLP